MDATLLSGLLAFAGGALGTGGVMQFYLYRQQSAETFRSKLELRFQEILETIYEVDGWHEALADHLV